MPAPRHRAPRPIRRLATVGAALVVAATALLAAPPDRASGVVTPLSGYRATVAGFTSWYGSYAMAGLGTAWCIDHGIHAPDPALAYRVADLSSVPPTTRVAMAWVLGRHAAAADRVGHAAVMLVLHDLMGARYPYGDLDVDRLSVRDLAGFAGQEGRLLERARALKADGLRHAHLRDPISLDLRVGAPDPAGAVRVVVTARDAAGAAVAGLPVTLEASTGTTLATRSGTTALDGTVRTSARPVRLPLTVRANAIVPKLQLDAWAPTTRRAQRVARPAVQALTVSAGLAAPSPTTTTSTVPPSTTTTAPPTTTTTAPPSTTTTVAPTTTTIPAPPTTLAVVAPSSSTSSPASASTTTGPPVTVLTAPPATPALPRTGVDAVGLGLLAIGLVLLGLAALEARRQRVSGLAPIGHHGGDGGIRPR